MKILMVNTINLEKNGVTSFIVNSSKVLVKLGEEVTIAASNNLSSDLSNELDKSGIKYIKLPPRKRAIFSYYRELKEQMQKGKFDIVHIHGNSTTMTLELLAAKQAGIKARIVHSHNTTTDHPYINKLFKPLFTRLTVGRVACNNAAGNWLFDTKRFIVIKNGIFLKDYAYNSKTRMDIRKQIDVSADDVLLGHVGFFNYQKNHDFFLKLMPLLANKYKLLLIGDGVEFKEFNEKVKQANLESRIKCIGLTNKVPEYLNAIDAFVLPSRYEGQPFVIIEALASGLNCLISDKVSKEIDITKNSLFLPLDAKKWANSLENIKVTDRKNQCTRNQEVLVTEGYDTVKNTKLLREYYLQLLGK